MNADVFAEALEALANACETVEVPRGSKPRRRLLGSLEIAQLRFADLEVRIRAATRVNGTPRPSTPAKPATKPKDPPPPKRPGR